MNHSFTPSISDALLCAKCKYDQMAHTNQATCEVCSNTGNMELFTETVAGRTITSLLCGECIARAKKAIEEMNAPGAEQARVELANKAAQENQIINKSRQIDQTIQISSDFFNAATLPIQELMLAVDGDDSIVNKAYRKTELLIEKIDSYQTAIFAKQQELIKLQSEQRAFITAKNTMANQLRAEERERLKIQDTNYKPIEPKTPKPRTSSKSQGKTFKKQELMEICAKYNVPAGAVQTVATAQNLSIAQAAEKVARQLGLL